MKNDELLRLLGEMDEDYVAQAHAPAKGRRFRRVWTSAACLAILAGLWLLHVPEQEAGIPEPPPPRTEETTPVGVVERMEKADDLVCISMKDVAVNELYGIIQQVDMAYSLDCKTTYLFDEQIWAYFGRDFTPPYVPEGLIPNAVENGRSLYITTPSGEILADETTLEYFHAYDEYGNPQGIQSFQDYYGFRVRVHRAGRSCCAVYYIAPEEQLVTTPIAGVEVIIGCTDYGYGPYAPETHEPAGYYAFCQVEFELDGNQYQLHFYQLPLEEVVKVTASIITGTDNIIIVEE